MFVRGFAEIAEALVAIKRLQQFLMYDEFVAIKDSINNNERLDNKTAVSLRSLTAKWDAKNADNALDSLDLIIEKGQLLGVIGPVGSGKSSLLQTILGKILRSHATWSHCDFSR